MRTVPEAVRLMTMITLFFLSFCVPVELISTYIGRWAAQRFSKCTRSYFNIIYYYYTAITITYNTKHITQVRTHLQLCMELVSFVILRFNKNYVLNNNHGNPYTEAICYCVKNCTGIYINKWKSTSILADSCQSVQF